MMQTPVLLLYLRKTTSKNFNLNKQVCGIIQLMFVGILKSGRKKKNKKRMPPEPFRVPKDGQEKRALYSILKQ